MHYAKGQHGSIEILEYFVYTKSVRTPRSNIQSSKCSSICDKHNSEIKNYYTLPLCDSNYPVEINIGKRFGHLDKTFGIPNFFSLTENEPILFLIPKFFSQALNLLERFGDKTSKQFLNFQPMIGKGLECFRNSKRFSKNFAKHFSMVFPLYTPLYQQSDHLILNQANIS